MNHYLLVLDQFGYYDTYIAPDEELARLAWLFLISGLTVEVRDN